VLNPGDIVFVRGHLKSLADDAIKCGEWLMTRRDKKKVAHLYTHVAVYLGGNEVADAQGLRVSGDGTICRYAGD
jgi:hypothetical protein